MAGAGVDVAKGVRWARQFVGHVTGIRELSGGCTSTMLALDTDDGKSAVLRLVTNEPWRSHGDALTTRERDVQRLLADSAVPAPMSLALDAPGAQCGHPAHLMTLLPGSLDRMRTDDHSFARLADVLADIHAVTPTKAIGEYRSWAWESKFVVPVWASEPDVWRHAFAVLRSPPPAFTPCFIHRDFQHGNVLWRGDVITGVVDWVESSVGPAWLDVAHCATNIAIRHDSRTADAFASAYSRRTGVEAQPYFDVMDIVGFLPPPGERILIPDPAHLVRLEERLRAVLERL